MINDKTDNHSCVSTTTEKNNFLCACACVNKNIEISNSNFLFLLLFLQNVQDRSYYTVAELPQVGIHSRDFRLRVLKTIAI